MRVLRTKAWMAWAENIALVLIISFAFYTTLPVKTTRTLLVPQGSITHIISQLTQKGYALSPIDKYILVFLGKPQSGWVDIGETDLNRIDFLYKLTTAKAKMEEITLIPGETTELFLTSVATDLALDKTKLETYYKKFSNYPEAAIYADTYYVPYGITEKHFIYFLLSESEKKYEEISEKILMQLKRILPGKRGVLVIKGPNIGDEFFIEKDKFIIGRSPESDVFLDDITVSRKHALLKKDGVDYRLIDSGSLNGSYLNGNIVEEAILSNGDRIQIGKYIFLYFSPLNHAVISQPDVRQRHRG